MTTLKNLLALMNHTVCDFSEDAFVQVLDHWTGAHYRRTADGIELGGELIALTEEEIMQSYVYSIDYENDHCMIYMV